MYFLLFFQWIQFCTNYEICCKFATKLIPCYLNKFFSFKSHIKVIINLLDSFSLHIIFSMPIKKRKHLRVNRDNNFDLVTTGGSGSMRGRFSGSLHHPRPPQPWTRFAPPRKQPPGAQSRGAQPCRIQPWGAQRTWARLQCQYIVFCLPWCNGIRSSQFFCKILVFTTNLMERGGLQNIFDSSVEQFDEKKMVAKSIIKINNNEN